MPLRNIKRDRALCFTRREELDNSAYLFVFSIFVRLAGHRSEA